MTWEWSHTAEAYENVKANIEAKSREWLEVVFAEWRASQDKKGNVTQEFNRKKYDRALAYAKGMSREQLVEFIWERTSELGNCTNGGWQAWCCPYGCGCHMVSFDLEAVSIN